MGLRILKQQSSPEQTEALAEALRIQEQFLKVTAQRWSQMQDKDAAQSSSPTLAFREKIVEVKKMFSSDLDAAERASQAVREWQKNEFPMANTQAVNVKMALSLLD